MPSLFAPIGRLPYAQKFVLISLLFLLPLAVTLSFLVNAQNQQRVFSQKEIDGANYLVLLNEVHAQALQYRRQALRVNIRREDAALLDPLQLAIDDNFAALATIDARYGAALTTNAPFATLAEEWQQLSATPVLAKPHDIFLEHSAFIANVRKLIALVGDQSNLILDPDLDSYYVMDSVLLRLPEAQDLIARAQLVSEDILPIQDLRSDKRTELVMLTSMLRSNSAAIVNNLDVAYANNPSQTLQARIDAERRRYLATIDDQLAVLDAIIANRGQAFATPEFTLFGNAALEASRVFQQTLSPALIELLQARIDALNRNQTSTLTMVALTVTAALAIGCGGCARSAAHSPIGCRRRAS
ncbi:hypothetical protein HC891_16670 [Candidatus Gracilibacteria bacterium]|nr:hypothetical protein [Candidatus Gracilibacteria bacterium]